jgi:hypothetical protein
MLLRVLSILAALAGSFGIAAWAVGPRSDWGMPSAAPKGDKLPVNDAPSGGSRRGASDPLRPAQDAMAAQPTRATSPRSDTALLDPTATVSAPVNPQPVSPPVAKPARADNKPFRCPRGVATSSDALTVAQIARVKAALNLTPAQEKDWRPVEAGLAAMARQIETARSNGRKVMIPAEQTQNLYLAAGPLVLSLREEQKRDARNLACSLGLGAVAALI